MTTTALTRVRFLRQALRDARPSERDRTQLMKLPAGAALLAAHAHARDELAEIETLLMGGGR